MRKKSEKTQSNEKHPVQMNQYGPDLEKMIREAKQEQSPGKNEEATPGGFDPSLSTEKGHG